MTVDRERLRQRLIGTFARELDEHVATMNASLLDLEKSSDGPEREECVRTLFRSAHSIKGAARIVGLESVEKTAHDLEETLAQLRAGEVSVSPELIRSLFASVDMIERVGADLAPVRKAPGFGDAAVPQEQKSDHSPGAPEPDLGGAAVSADRPETVVRIDPEKLEALVRANGEMMVARRRTAGRIDELDTLRELAQAWSSQWIRREPALRQHLSSAIPASEESAAAAHSPSAALETVDQNREFLRRMAAELEQISERVSSDHRQLERAAVPLQDQIHQMRMQPLRLACEPLQRVVRDLAEEAGKAVELSIRGGEIELDRPILEALGSPLVHLVRNAIDHGIESPEERRQLGKPTAGRVLIEASLEGAGIAIEISDDGRGLDVEALKREAERKGLTLPDDEAGVANVIFQAGFSTAPSLTAVSGRGIGLDVVRSRVESLQGTVRVDSEAGRGTWFRITLPLTLATIRALLVRSGGETLAIPSAGIERMQRVLRSEIRSVEGRDVLRTAAAPIPLVSLADLLGLSRRTDDGESLVVVRVRADPREIALVVDESIREQEIIVKNLGVRLSRVRGVSGATVLETGRIALILHVAELIELAITTPLGSIREPEREQKVRRRLIVADDSITTRTLVKSILEAAGYDVLTASDGEEAWQILQHRGADLVVSDVEMPRVDGIELTKTIRSSSRFAQMPIVLVTARESEQDRARGAEAGADAYLVKSAFEQQSLLEAVRRLL